MKNMTFRMKLILFVVGVGLMPVIITAILSYNMTTKDLEEAIFRGNEAFLEDSISRIETYFHKRNEDAVVIGLSENIHEMINSAHDLNSDDEVYLNNIKTAYGYSFIFVMDLEGTIIASSEESLIGVSLPDRDYFVNGTKKEGYWSDLFYSSVVEENVMVHGHPVVDEDEIIGVLCLAINQGTINELTHGNVKKLGESGDAYLVNADQLLISDTLLGDYTDGAALVESVVTEGTKQLGTALTNNNSDYKNVGIYLDYRSTPVLGALGVVRLGREEVGILIEVDVSEAMAPLENIKKLMIILVAFIVVVAAGLSFIIISSIIKPIKNVNLMLADIGEGEGDLTKRLHIQTKDEFGELGRLFNEFIEKLQRLIGGIAINANSLTVSTGDISSSVDDNNKSLESINTKVTEINDNINTNASVIEETNASIEEIVSSATIISEKAEEVASYSDEVIEATKVGSNNLEIARASVLDVQEISSEMSNVMGRLNSASNEIGTIVDVITGISEQINLLALNAAIEAARAGEHGKGFAVVADEVRKLAEESRQSATNITGFVKEIVNEVKNANLSVEKEQKQVDISVKNIQDTNEEFESILGKVVTVSENIKNITEMVVTQRKITEDVSNAMEDITMSTQKSANATADITTAITNQSASFEEITASIEELSSMAEVLQSETDRFKV